jgi:hypothetical protein
LSCSGMASPRNLKAASSLSAVGGKAPLCLQGIEELPMRPLPILALPFNALRSDLR